MHVFRAGSLALVVSLVAAACAADPPDAYVTAPVTTAPVTTAPVTTVAPTTTVAAPSTTVAASTTVVPTTADAPTTTVAGPPPGIVSASPFQYRLDWAASIFQMRIRNQSPDGFTIVGVQFVWDGITTPVTPRHDTLVPGLTLDFPVTFAGATCAGDGLIDDMPSMSGAVARLSLDDGSTMDVPVFDTDGVAQSLYLDDCERQMIQSEVTIEWHDLHDEPLDGRIVTGGSIRVARKNSTSSITVQSVSNTVLFAIVTLDSGVDDPVAILPAGEDEIDVPIRIIENRCDSHARAESSQSFRFVAQVDLGDGTLHPYFVLPTKDEQVAIRARFEAGCTALDATGFVGQDDDN